MDPFSLTVGIGSLVALTAQTLNITKAYAHEARYGKEAAAELLRELDVLHYNLSQLDKFLRSDRAIRPFDNTSVLVTSTSACRTQLGVLYKKLNGAGESLLSRVKWPLHSKEHRETVQDLRAFAQWIQFALTVDGCALLSKTSAEVLETLKLQLDTFQLVKSVDHRTRILEQSLEHQAKEAKHARAAEERERTLEWLSAIRHEQKHHDVRVQRMDGTGEWLLQDKEFRRWRDELKSGNNVLWCHGIQGSGKSVLASLVVDRLRDTFLEQNVAIAHMYFDYRDQEHQSTENVTASLLKQLAMANAALPQSVLELYQRLKGQQRKPQQQDLEHAILNTCQNFDRVFIIIDALDECDESKNRKSFLNFLKNLWGKSSSKLFVTSRPYPDDVQKVLEGSSKIMIKADDLDLRRYISREIHRSEAVEDINEKFKNEIIEKVVQGARQMFLLAVLQVKAILNEPSAGEMEDALEAMPRGLHDAFEETLQRIQKQSQGRKRLGMNTLMWISYARRPLKVMELGEALAINLKPGETFSNPKYWQSQRMMVASCLGLVTVDEESSIIRLVHYSVQEYLREHQNRVFPFAEQIIAKSLITFLLYDSFALGCRRKESEIFALMVSQPFDIYAARYWGDHVRNANDPSVDTLALKLLRAAPQRACSIQISQYSRDRREEYWSAMEVESRNGLHVAAGFGLESLAKQLLDSDALDVDFASKIGTTALIEAAATGHKALIRMLLDKGADPTKENWYGTALHCAAESGELVSISELLSTGLDVDMRDRDGRTALHCATISGHVGAMQLLLNLGAQVDALSDQRYTPLRYAVVWEQTLEIIRLLLVNRADTGILSKSGFTVLHHAAEVDLEDVLNLLLEFGADPNARRHTHGVTPLHLAAEKDNIAIVNVLLDRGADVNATTQDGVTALYSAAEHGCEETVRLLLSPGRKAVVDAADEEGLTPLHVAAKENHKSIVHMLLHLGKADVNARSRDGGSALDFAFEKGYDGIALLLLDYGAVRQAGVQQYWLTAGEGISTPSVVKTIELPYRCNEMVPSDRQASNNTNREGIHSPIAVTATPPEPSFDDCQLCKERKAKCDRAVPKCGQCQDSGIECVPPLVLEAGKPRRRFTEACIRCRKTKSKCDEAKPECSHCKDSGMQCTFRNNVKI